MRLLLYDDEAPIRIHQAQFRLQKRFANRLGFLLGYTLGSAKSIADGGTPSDHYDPMVDWGPTANDVRHRFVSNVIYELPWGIPGRAPSSRPTRRRRTTSRSAPTPTATATTSTGPAGVEIQRRPRRPVLPDRPAAVEEGHHRPRLGELLWEMFNVFNTVNFNNYNGNQSSAAGVTATGIPTGFGRPRQAFDPFQAQLGLKLTF